MSSEWIMQVCPEIAKWQAEIIYEQVRIRVESELRRLHAELDRCKATCAATSECWRGDADRWEAQRDALLEALRLIAGLISHPKARQKALDAIAKVEGQQ